MIDTSQSHLLQSTLDAIDRENERDPNHEVINSQTWTKERLYSHRLTEWVRKLTDSPSMELLIAARAQHICRWKSPRSDYPSGRVGYLKWRRDLQRFHADKTAEIMRKMGCDAEVIAKTSDLLRKKNASKDLEGQILEDAVCLVFLEFELEKFSAKTEMIKVVDIIRKTWKKMSPAAHAQALVLPLYVTQKTLVKEALSP